MIDYISVLEELEKTTGSNDKIAILKKNKNNIWLEKYLFLTADDRITFGVKKFDLPEGDGRFDDVRAFENFNSLVIELSNRALTGQAALDRIALVFSWFSPIQQKWFKKCLQKDLASIGLGCTNINKGFEKKLVLNFNCSGAKQEKDIDKMVYPADAQWKVNGFRTFFYTDENGMIDRTPYCELKVPIGRSGLPIENFAFLNSYIEKLGLKNKVIDGEVECDDNLQEIQSLSGFDLTKTENDFKNKKGQTTKDWAVYCERKVEILDIASRSKFRVFEILDKDQFDNENVKGMYIDRRKLVESIDFSKCNGYVYAVEAETVNSKEEAYTIADRYISQGKEGIVLKSHQGKYGFTKDNTQIKIKIKTEPVDCKIVGWEVAKVSYKTNGEPYPPMLGKLIVEYFNNKNELKVSGVGTGKLLTRAFKLAFAADPDSFMERIVICTSQEFTADEGVMSCPRVEDLRPIFDKNKL